VSVIDTVTNTVVATIQVGLAPNGVALTPDGKRAYVANWSSNNVSVIDTTTKAVVGSPIPIMSAPQGIAVTPNGKSVYVTAEPNAVVVIDTATNAIVGPPIPVGNSPACVAVTPDGKHAYVTNEGVGTVSVIKTGTKNVVSGREARLCHERKHADRHGRGDQSGDEQGCSYDPGGRGASRSCLHS
jgi:YVTN family beta-propeller protein